MEEQLISFETAKLAKEKGFNILSHSYYFEDGEFKENSLTGTNGYYGEDYEFNLSEFNENWNDKWKTTKEGDRCFGCDKDPKYLETFSAPVQSLLQKWLREVHNIHIVIVPYFDKNKDLICGFDLFLKATEEEDIFEDGFKTYEEALEIGLYQALLLI